MRCRLLVLSLLSLFVALASFSISATEVPESDKPIKIIVNDWSSQIVLSRATGILFQGMGYNVTYEFKSTSEQWGALKRGIGHVQVEVWEGTMAAAFHRVSDSGGLDDAGTHTATTREDWWYPDYVESFCPGLPDWKALKRCSSLFSVAATHPKGVYYGGPWERPDTARARALGLDFVVEKLNQGEDLAVKLKQAFSEQRPIVLFNWTPNWVETKYPGKFIEFPKHEEECETNIEWGVNKDFLFDCGNPLEGWLKKVAWSGMKAEWPCAYQTLANMNFTNDMVANAAAFVDVKGLSYEEAAQAWIKQYTSEVQHWIPDKCALN